MYDMLNDFGSAIQRFLDAVLPCCDAQWWNNCVLSRLTFQQRWIVEEKGITSLTELNLAGLLFVLDQNWQEINVTPLPFEARNWLKEAQTIATDGHICRQGVNPEDRERDLDLLYPLMTALCPDDSSVSRMRTV